MWLLFSLNLSDWRSLPNTSSAKPSKIIQHMESSAIPNCRSCLNSDTSGGNKSWVSSYFSIRAGSLILTSILSLTSVNGIIMMVSTRNMHPVITPCKWYQHLAIIYKELIYLKYGIVKCVFNFILPVLQEFAEFHLLIVFGSFYSYLCQKFLSLGTCSWSEVWRTML